MSTEGRYGRDVGSDSGQPAAGGRRGSAPRLVVAGIGGGGAGALETLAADPHPALDFMQFHTDRPTLERSAIDQTVLIGPGHTDAEGLSMLPDDLAPILQHAREEGLAAFEDVGVAIFVVALGGSTGTSMLPVLADAAQQRGCRVVTFAFLPFSAERTRKLRALECIQSLQGLADIVFTFDNDHLLQKVPNLPIEEAFDQLDRSLASAVREFTAVLLREIQALRTRVRQGLVEEELLDLVHGHSLVGLEESMASPEGVPMFEIVPAAGRGAPAQGPVVPVTVGDVHRNE